MTQLDLSQAKSNLSELLDLAILRNEQEEPVHSFQTLLDDLGTIYLNTVEAVVAGKKIVWRYGGTFKGLYQNYQLTRATPLLPFQDFHRLTLS